MTTLRSCCYHRFGFYGMFCRELNFKWALERTWSFQRKSSFFTTF